MRVKVSLGMEAPEAMAMIEMNQPRVTLALLEFALLPSNSWQWIFLTGPALSVANQVL